MLTKIHKIPKKYFLFSTIRTFAKLSSGCRAEESSSKKSFLVETESDFHKIRFGSQSNGKPWPGNVSAQIPVPHLPHSKVPHLPHSLQVTSWVCATIPMAGTVTYDCIPEVAGLPLLVFGCLDPQPPLSSPAQPPILHKSTQCLLSGCHSLCLTFPQSECRQKMLSNLGSR